MPVRPEDVPEASLVCAPCHRLIASRYPTVGLYDDIARPEDLDVVFAIEALTNPRLRQELGALSLVAPADRVSGPGASLIMAAFTHLNPEGSRFSDGSWGVYYAADTLDTAIAEVGHHRAVFLARTAEPEIDVDLRWIQADLRVRGHDIRAATMAGAGGADGLPDLSDIYDRNHYGASQALARALRSRGSPALAYDSVRRAGGLCMAVFVPRALTHARAAGHLSLHWDGQRISHWFKKSEPHPMRADSAAGPGTETRAPRLSRRPSVT